MSLSEIPVKVTKSGNSKMLPMPAGLAREAGADVGDAYTVEIVGDDIIYHPASSSIRIVGTGSGRAGIVASGRALRTTGRSSVAPLDSWDF